MGPYRKWKARLSFILVFTLLMQFTLPIMNYAAENEGAAPASDVLDVTETLKSLEGAATVAVDGDKQEGGNQSAAVQPPDAPMWTMTLPWVTNQQTVTLTIITTPKAMVTFYANGWPINEGGGDNFADEQGNYSFTYFLDKEQKYEFRATAQLGGLESYSVLIETKLDLTAPQAPSKGKWTSASFDQIMLQWTKPVGEAPSGYAVYRNGEKIGTAPAPFFEDTNLAGRSKLKYEIASMDAAGNESDKHTVYAATRDEKSVMVSDPTQHEAENAVISADGSTVAYVYRNYDDSGYLNLELFIRDLGTNELIKVPFDKRAYLLTPSISGDGKKVAFFLSDGNEYDGVYIYDRSKGTGPENQAEAIYDGFSIPIISQDGESVFLRQEEKVLRVDLATDSVTTEFTVDTDQGTIQGIDQSPDGKYLLYEHSYGDGMSGAIILHNTGTKEHITVAAQAKDAAVSSDGRYVVLVKEADETVQESGIYLYDLHSLETPTKLLPEEEDVYYSHPMVSADGTKVVVEFYDSTPEMHYTIESKGFVYVDVKAQTSRRLGDPTYFGDEMSFDFSGNGRLAFVGPNTATKVESEYYAYFPDAVYALCPDVCGDVQTPPSGGITAASWRSSALVGGQAQLGSDIILELRGAANASVNAIVQYRTDKEITTDVVLAETSPGTYRGTFTIADGITEITSVRYMMTEEGGATAEREVTHPIAVSGRIVVAIETADAEALVGGKLIATSPIGNAMSQLELTGPAPYVLEAEGGKSYKVSLYSKEGRKLTESLENIKVISGAEASISLRAVIPARASIQIVDELGAGVGGIPVTLYSLDQERAMRYTISSGVTNEKGNLSLHASHVGTLIQVVPRLSDPYASADPQQIIAKGMNEFKFTTRLKKGTVQGTVKDEQGQPVANALVSVTRPGGFETATTDADGKYALTVPVGSVRVEAAQTAAPFLRSKEYASLTVTDGKISMQDLTVYRKANGNITVNMSIKYVGFEPTRIEIGWRTGTTYPIKVTDQQGNARPYILGDNQLLLVASPGETLTVCADSGSGNFFGAACADVKLDEKRLGTADLLLKEHSVVKGALKVDSQSFKSVIKTLYVLDANGQKVGEGRNYYGAGGDGTFQITLPSSGSYLMEVTGVTYNGGKVSIVREFQAVEDQVVELGEIALKGSPGPFGSGDGNRLTALATEAVNGQNLTFRGTYYNNGDSPVSDARLLIEVPSGAALIDGSVMLNNEAAEAKPVSASIYEVQVGSVEAKKGGTFYYRLNVQNAVGEAVHNEARMRYMPDSGASWKEDIVGTMNLPVASLTLLAPNSAASLEDVPINGRAPAGTEVMIYDGDYLIGQATATPGGYWNAKVTLHDRGINTQHLLMVKATAGGKGMISDTHALRLTPDEPVPVRFTVQQEGARKFVIEASAGASRFPYVARNDENFYYTVEFDKNPDAVERVVFYDDRRKYAAVRVPNTNIFMAKGNTLKPIRVAYDVKPTAAVDLTKLTTADMEKSLPDVFKDFEFDVLSEAQYTETKSIDGTSVITSPTVRVTDPNNPEVSFDTVFKFEPIDYIPPGPPEDGLPEIYEASLNVNQGAGGVTVHSSAIIRKNSAEMQALTSESPELSRMINKSAGEFVKFTAGQTFKDVKPYFVLLNTARQALVFDERMDELERMMQQVEGSGCLGGGKVNHYAGQLERLADGLLSNLVWQYTVTLAGIGLSASGVGAPVGIAVAAVGFGISMLHEAVWQSELAKTKAELAADIAASDGDCENDEDDGDGDSSKPDRKPGTRPSKPLVPGPERDWEIGDPLWLFDPSGYVYEAVPTNRVEGVTATLYQWNESSNEWEMWNAEWFGQINPQITDFHGKYGWDVPEGLWQVVYEKDGYEIARSEELTVLPPHFDVNIPLLSNMPPKVESVYDEVGVPGVRIDFTKYMKAELLMEGHIRVSVVTDDVESEIPVKITMLDPYGEGEQRLAKSIRIEPSEEGMSFEEGSQLIVRINKQLESYAGVLMREDEEHTILLGSFLEPEEAISEVTAVASYNAVNLLWDESPDVSIKGLKLYWKEKGAATDSTQEIETNRGGIYTVEQLESGKEYEFRLVTVSRSGVESDGVTVSATPLKEEVYVPDATPPGPVANAQGTVTDGKLALSWTDPTDIDLYRVKIAVKKPGEDVFGKPVLVADGVQQYALTNLIEGVYSFKLSTIDIRNNESEAVEINVNVETTKPDTVPPGPAANVTLKASYHQLLVSWSDPVDEDFADVRIAVKHPGRSDYDEPVTISKGVQQFSLRDIPAGLYRLQVSTADHAGNVSSPVSYEVTVPEPETAPPAAVKNLQAVTAPNRMTISWVDPTDTDLSHILVEVKKPNESSFGEPITVLKNAGVLAFTNVPKGTYTLRVTAVSNNGKKSQAEQVNARVTGNPWGDTGNGKPMERQASTTFTQEAKIYKPFGNLLTLDAAEGTFSAKTTVTVTKRLITGKEMPVQLLPLSEQFEIKGTKKMEKPISLTLQYMDFKLPWIKSEKLALYRLDDSGRWNYAGGVTRVKGFLTVDISEWGTYAVMRLETLNLN